MNRTARLLVVDDNRDILDMLTVLLGEKYQVRGCESAAQALASLPASRPELLLIDIRMTSVDGVQCLEAIRATPGYSSTPAIALTAFARDAEREAFLAAGFQAVVTKPILDQRDLESAIDALLTSASQNGSRAGEYPLTGSHENGMISSRGTESP